MQEGVKELEAEMSRIKATLDEKTKEVEEAKRTASKAAKVLEQAEKEITLRVRAISKKFVPWSFDGLTINLGTRTMKLRGWASSARACTVNAASRRSSYRWSPEISRMCPWKRCAVALTSCNSLLFDRQLAEST